MARADRNGSDIPELTSLQIFHLIEQAARLLSPVYLNFGLSQPRFRSFIDSIQGKGKEKRLLVSPIAASAIPTHIGAKIQIHPLYKKSDWELSVTRVEPVDEITAAIRLEDARFSVVPDAAKSTLQPAYDPLILVVPAGIEEENPHIFLISEIGSNVCVIEATVPFEPGTAIPLVEIIGEKRILREAAANVTKVEPWFMPDGTRRFRCFFDLSQPRVKGSSDVFDRVKDVKRVHRIMDLAGMLTVYGWYEVEGYGREVIRFLKVERDHALLECCSTRLPKFQKRTTIRIGVDVFAIYYEMEVRILEVIDRRIRVTLPLVLRRRRRHRRAERVSIPPRYDLTLEFFHPAIGRIRERSIEEISFVGLTFLCSNQDPVWEGLVLERSELVWKGQRIRLGDLDVRSITQRDDTLLCHTSINKPSAVNDPTFINLIATLSHPDIRFYQGNDFSSLVDIYMQAGLFSPHMHRNLNPLFQEAKTVWTKLHSGASDIARTLLQGPIDSPNVAMTSIRAWERTWLAQHFFSINSKLDHKMGKLQLAQLDHFLPRSEGHYVVFFVRTDNTVMNAFLQNFLTATGRADAVTIITVELWYHPGDRPFDSFDRNPNIAIRLMRGDDQERVSRAAEKCLGIQPAAALSMLPGEFALPNTSKIFAKADLQRDRVCKLVTYRRKAVYAVLEERSSPGLNLTWMLNANWILPIHCHHDRDGQVIRSVLQSILDAPAQSPLGDRFINLPQRMNKKPFEDAGFELISPVNLYVFNRAGLQRLYYYAAGRYGVMNALVRRRNARKKNPDVSPKPSAATTT
jgi:hypothetical protein